MPLIPRPSPNSQQAVAAASPQRARNEKALRRLSAAVETLTSTVPARKFPGLEEAHQFLQALLPNVRTEHTASAGIEEELARTTVESQNGFDSDIHTFLGDETDIMAGDEETGLTEYHVVYVEDPQPRWEVQYGKKRMGYQAWDKRVATSAAKELAKANRPSKVIIHERGTGKAETELAFDAAATKRSKGLKRKLD